MNTLWALRDTMATSVKGLTVDSFAETTTDISWTALAGAEMYEYKWDSTSACTVEDETEATLSGLTDKTPYTVMVRVPASAPSRAAGLRLRPSPLLSLSASRLTTYHTTASRVSQHGLRSFGRQPRALLPAMNSSSAQTRLSALQS